jgi:hypothetical protein
MAKKSKTYWTPDAKGHLAAAQTVEQGSAASGEISPGGAAQTGVVPSSGEAGEAKAKGRRYRRRHPACRRRCRSRQRGTAAAGDQAGDAADRPAAEGADTAVSDCGEGSPEDDQRGHCVGWCRAYLTGRRARWSSSSRTCRRCASRPEAVQPAEPSGELEAFVNEKAQEASKLFHELTADAPKERAGTRRSRKRAKRSSR